CGHTEGQCENTRALLGGGRFEVVHVAMYSPRAGTASASIWEDDVPLEEKKSRLHEVELIQAQTSAEINPSMVGTLQDVLVEGTRQGNWYVRPRNNKILFFQSD